jgi:Protein of unknown function (DUF2924)
VVVTEDGFEYADKSFSSLTKIAHAITGAHWSEPRFFGLIRKHASNGQLGSDADSSSVLKPCPGAFFVCIAGSEPAPQQTQDVFCDSITFRHRWFFARGIGTMTGLELDGRQIRRFTRTASLLSARM